MDSILGDMELLRCSDVRVTLAELYVGQIYLEMLCRTYFRERKKKQEENEMSGWTSLLALGYLGQKSVRVSRSQMQTTWMPRLKKILHANKWGDSETDRAASFEGKHWVSLWNKELEVSASASRWRSLAAVRVWGQSTGTSSEFVPELGLIVLRTYREKQQRDGKLMILFFSV